MELVVDGTIDELERIYELVPAAVTVTRTSEADIKTRQMPVWLDGDRVATLMWGDSVTRELAPGPHRLRVSNTLMWKTLDFTLKPGEQLFFETINSMGPGTILMTMMFGLGPLYVVLRRM
jgi:hypothetical protein